MNSDPPPAAPQQRGGCLTALLVLMMIVNPLVAINYFINGEKLARVLHASPAIMPVLGLLSLINTVCAIGLWNWKKWGFYGFLAMSGIAFAINLSLGLGAPAVLGLIGPVIMFALVRPLLPHMT